MADYFLVRSDQARMEPGFLPYEQFSDFAVEKYRGSRLNVAGGNRNMVYYHLDSRAMSEVIDSVEIYWEAEYDLLLQELEEQNYETR